MKLGVVEGFFGPAWPPEAREAYASFLGKFGGDFYIYAPKQDQCLRKSWRDAWSPEYVGYLKTLGSRFREHGVEFGVGLSPFGLGERLIESDREILQKKLQTLTEAGIDILGVFFDDMPPSKNLARVQGEVTKLIQSSFKGKIVFCPSYYSFDPILEKVFGKMPDHYLEDIARLIPTEVSLAWTGPKVISPEIPLEHLVEVEGLLKRSPFMWENLFANDGPKNCKFLKLRPFEGREGGLAPHTEAWGLNMMNQPFLSQITFLSSLNVLKKGATAEDGFEAALRELCSPGFAQFIRTHRKDFLEKGLDQIPHEEKSGFLHELRAFSDPAAREIKDWLKGLYIVGSECLTD